MDRNVRPLLVDLAVGLAAGLFANWATDLVQGPLRRATPDSVRRREARVSPGPSSSYSLQLIETAAWRIPVVGGGW